MSGNSPFKYHYDEPYNKSPGFKKISRNPYLNKNYSTKKLPFLTHNIMNLIQFFQSLENNNNINISPLNILSKLKSVDNFNQSLNDFENIDNIASPLNNNIGNNNEQNKNIMDLFYQNLDNLKRQNIMERTAGIGPNNYNNYKNYNNNNNNNNYNNHYNNNNNHNHNNYNYNNNYNNNNHNHNNYNKYNNDNYIKEYNNDYPIINNNSNLNNPSGPNIKIIHYNNKMVRQKKKYNNNYYNNNYDNNNNNNYDNNYV